MTVNRAREGWREGGREGGRGEVDLRACCVEVDLRACRRYGISNFEDKEEEEEEEAIEKGDKRPRGRKRDRKSKEKAGNGMGGHLFNVTRRRGVFLL